MYNDIIKKLLRKLGAAPECLILKILVEVYGESESTAANALYDAYRKKIIYKQQSNAIDFAVWHPDFKIVPKCHKVASALSTAISLLPDSENLFSDFEFILADYPYEIAFILPIPDDEDDAEDSLGQNTLVRIIYCEKGDLFSTGYLLQSLSIPKNVRDFIYQIAIVPMDVDFDALEYLKRKGIALVCQTNDVTAQVFVIQDYSEDEDLWEDIPEPTEKVEKFLKNE